MVFYETKIKNHRLSLGCDNLAVIKMMACWMAKAKKVVGKLIVVQTLKAVLEMRTMRSTERT
jgi:hypothetical protein